MLKVYNELGGKNVKSAERGDANSFLRSVLVEVATENYRQLMFESLSLVPTNGARTPQLHLDPPLRANERVISGLFANAIARVAPRSRPEARIDRTESQETIDALVNDDLGGAELKSRAGRVDYLAWYGQRIFGVELKAAAMNCEKPQLTETVRNRWKTVVDQAKSAQTHLLELKRSEPHRYPSPASLALMVIIGRRSMARQDREDDHNSQIETMESDFMKAFTKLDPEPTFRALYTFPQEFRSLVPRKRGHADPSAGKAIYTPFVAFLAKSAIKGTS